jgi:hypothetical protein
MTRPRLRADALRDELNQAALRLSLDSEGAKIEFKLPTLAEPDEGLLGPGMAGHNWDVQAYCPETLDTIARKAVEQVAAQYDLDPQPTDDDAPDLAEA